MADRESEDVVRDYLRYVADPTSVRPDTTEIDARIAEATDPVERVKLRSERSRLQDVGPTLEADFVTAVGGWAREHGVDPEALLEEGVERRVLIEAGLVAGSPGRRPSADRAGGAGGSRQRPPRVSRADLERYVRGLRAGTTFTTATVRADVGGSPGTVRKVLDALLEEGVIVEDGKDHSGPGRPRTLYARA